MQIKIIIDYVCQIVHKHTRIRENMKIELFKRIVFFNSIKQV